MSFPFGDLRAETLRAIARDLSIPHQVAIRKDTILSYYASINEKGLAETRKTFVVPQVDPSKVKKRKTFGGIVVRGSSSEEDGEDPDGDGERDAKKAKVVDSKHAYATRNGGKRPDPPPPKPAAPVAIPPNKAPKRIKVNGKPKGRVPKQPAKKLLLNRAAGAGGEDGDEEEEIDELDSDQDDDIEPVTQAKKNDLNMIVDSPAVPNGNGLVRVPVTEMFESASTS